MGSAPFRCYVEHHQDHQASSSFRLDCKPEGGAVSVVEVLPSLRVAREQMDDVEDPPRERDEAGVGEETREHLVVVGDCGA